MTSTAPSRPIGGRSRLLTAPAMAGVAYLVAWVTGLAVWPSNLSRRPEVVHETWAR